MASRFREREDKYLVDAAWQMPDLAGALPDDAHLSTATAGVSSLYFDTGDHALLDHGITLRRRTGDLETGWQLKLPNGDARTEIRVEANGSARAVPAELRGLLTGVRADGKLAPVAKIDTERRLTRILDASGAVLAEVADDQVHSAQVGEAALVTTWREVEVEAGTGDDRLLRRVGRILRAAGAKRAPVGASKLAHALGGSSAGNDAAAPAQTLEDLTMGYLDAQYREIVSGDLALRDGAEPIHAIRVAIRRYRSVLHVLADVFDADRSARLNTELAWYAGLLGEVRDRQVLRAHLGESVQALPPELVLGPVSARIEEQLLAEQARAKSRLMTAMRGRRYAALMADLREWHRQPPLTPAGERSSTKIGKYLRQAQRTLDRRLAAARADRSDNERVHRARKAGKRARYIAELAEPVLGKSVRRYAKRATAMQDALGAHQDSVVARDVLRRLGSAAAKTPGDNGFTFGLLYAHEAARAEQSRKHARAQINRL